MEKVSFMTTVKNDPKGLKILLNSLKLQSRQPDEVIVIDGVNTGTNRAQGRNLGIQKAKGEIIAISDTGCKLEKKWLENITEPFEDPTVDVVAGYYQPITQNIFQQCLACYTSVMPEKVIPNQFLPSSRSIAFKKSAWRKAGGYPENLDYCEDLVFAQRLKKVGCKFKFEEKAIVFWPQRKNIFQAFKQFFNYASGDAQALYWPHLKRIGLVYLRYILGGILLFYGQFFYFFIFLLLYFSWAIWKNYGFVKHPAVFLYFPLLQITADLAVMIGALRGLLKKIKKWGK